ncbi:bifunctional riboflavin kinase/FAD synthetase [Antarcticibacterium flavum]|uniref:Riboflavin biosynthesis protein n=1 Tax=Antarcticibacterium flavum TaxID=2058175 RepID=A0A5B7X1I7_9FLAO|nr:MULTISPECIES: bifunctional riboflavin kinase/FAD synthetase [Antarcticibacterium]MCM4161135.1 riboflavin biosynthesis protein RibF [Antarcticibacterium sp. W02-3]QCY69366.1 bifunctional riboflavin kinase/FAD synthetase [Antarcticibacterium flavum]
MKEHKGANAFQSDHGTVITIGTFDGVHAGHQKIIERLVATARMSEMESAILTFFPHPRMVLQKESGIKLINTIEERKQILEKSGIDHLVIHPFTHQFSRLTALEFVRDILVNKLKAKKVIIGYDHRFGRNRTADINTLREYGERFGFDVEEISQQDVEDVAVSSTKIRKALMEGRVERANNYLQHPFSLTGIVVKGKGLGRDFGYPTANLHIEEDYKLIPKNGVYVVRAVIDAVPYYGMMNIGTNPTVGGKEVTIETYFFLLDKDLYGKKLQIEMLTRIRDEKKFDTVEALKRAMKQDEAFSEQYIRDNYAE